MNWYSTEAAANHQFTRIYGGVRTARNNGAGQHLEIENERHAVSEGDRTLGSRNRTRYSWWAWDL